MGTNHELGFAQNINPQFPIALPIQFTLFNNNNTFSSLLFQQQEPLDFLQQQRTTFASSTTKRQSCLTMGNSLSQQQLVPNLIGMVGVVDRELMNFIGLSVTTRFFFPEQLGPKACGSITGTATASGSVSFGGMMAVDFLLVSLSPEARIANFY
jgi:hypothetical protein